MTEYEDHVATRCRDITRTGADVRRLKEEVRERVAKHQEQPDIAPIVVRPLLVIVLPAFVSRWLNL